VKRVKPRSIVVSSEEFELESPNDVKTTIEGSLGDVISQLVVVAYVRPHISRVLSQYPTAMRHGNKVVPFSRYVNEVVSSDSRLYYPRLRRWSDVFGDQFQVRLFHRNT